MGIRTNVSRNNLSHANATRDWRIYADFAQVLIAEARSLYADEDLGIDLDALDASTIDLCALLRCEQARWRCGRLEGRKIFTAKLAWVRGVRVQRGD